MWIVALDCNLTWSQPSKRGRREGWENETFIESGRKGQRWRKRNKEEEEDSEKGEEEEEEEKEEEEAEEEEEEKEEEEKERHPSLSLADHYQCYSQN